MKKRQFLFLCLIVLFTLSSSLIYASTDESPTLKQPKVYAEYTGLQVSLTLDPNGNSAGHRYIIERSSSPTMTEDYKLVQDWDLSLVDADLVEPNKTYYYRTRLKDSKGNLSPWSDVISIHTVISNEPKKYPSQKTPQEVLVDKIGRMSIAEKNTYMADAFNYLPYTISPDQLDKTLKQGIRNSNLPGYEKDVFLLDLHLLDLLGPQEYRLFDNSSLGSTFPTFTDMPSNHWAYESAKDLYFNHIVSGYEDGSYRPNEVVTLAQALTFLDRTIQNHEITEFKRPRTEVEKILPPSDHWAYYHIASIGTKVDYKTLSLIKPENYDLPITRELLAQIIYSTTNGKLQTVSSSGGYRDMNITASPQALRYCLRSGLFQGIDQMIRPKDTLTQAELTVILSRLNDTLSSLE